jgi:hypothetical protein
MTFRDRVKPIIMKKRIEFVQAELKKQGLYQGDIDGIAGSGTLQALSQIPGLDPLWNLTRKVTGFIQIHCKSHGFDPGDIDGFWGPDTENAFHQYQYAMENGQPAPSWRPEDRVPVNPNLWPVQYTPQFDSFYGPKGSSLIRVQLPYPHKIAWDPKTVIHSFSCHSRVHDSLLRVLNKVVAHYGQARIEELRLDYWGGCYNERPIRGGNRWSMHSWAIAIDYDPVNNKLEWGRDKARFSKPEYDAWWGFWEEEGWVSLGRERNFDWMHVQAAKL